MTSVRLYALSTCQACKKVKALLKENKIPFASVEVDLLPGGEQWAAIKEMKRLNPEGTYPTTVIEKTVVGFDETALREALEMK